MIAKVRRRWISSASAAAERATVYDGVLKGSPLLDDIMVNTATAEGLEWEKMF
tara:strand:+ start:1363 stop:1521 length:159 start_codon:yes stop_codon:yes gene_type:complete